MCARTFPTAVPAAFLPEHCNCAAYKFFLMKEATNTELMEKGNVVLNTMIEADGIYDLISFLNGTKKRCNVQ